MIGASGAISGLFGGIIMVMYDAGTIGGRKTRARLVLPVTKSCCR